MNNIKIVILKDGKILISTDAEKYINSNQDVNFKVETHEVDIYTIK